MGAVIAFVIGLIIGIGLGKIIGSWKIRPAQKELENARRRCNSLNEQSDTDKREREQIQKNTDSQLRTKDLQIGQLRLENEGLKNELAELQA